MRKVVVISIREYIAAVKSKAFIITLVMMPVLMSFGLIAERFLGDELDIRDKRFAVIDHSGALFANLVQETNRRNAEDIYEKDDEGTINKSKQIRARYLLEGVAAGNTSHDELLLDLSDRVRNGDLFAFAEISPDVLDPPEDSQDPAVKYYSNTPTYHDLRRWLRGAVTTAVQHRRFSESGLDREKVDRAMRPTDLEHFSLLALDESTGLIRAAEKVDEAASFIIPAMMVMLLFMVIMVGASPLIQSVLEEKSQRIAEVLLASVTPFQWMMGKLIGMVGVSFTIVIIYLTGGLIVADRYGVMQLIPFSLLGWFMAYQALSVLMFGAVFVAVGAACTDHREAQSAIMPVMIVIVLPMMLWMHVAREPATPFAMVVSLFPPATPILMLVRQAVPPGIPLWQPILGMVLVLLTTVLCIFAAGRIFRVGILMQGKGASFRDMIRWIVKG